MNTRKFYWCQTFPGLGTGVQRWGNHPGEIAWKSSEGLMCSRLLLVTEEHLCGGRWAPALWVSADPMAPLEHFKKHIVQIFFPSSLQLSFKMWARKSWSLYLCLQKLDKTPPPKLIPNTLLKGLYRNHVCYGRGGKKMMQENHMCLCVSPQPWSCVLLSPSPHT